jgi:hypothetical protein
MPGTLDAVLAEALTRQQREDAGLMRFQPMGGGADDHLRTDFVSCRSTNGSLEEEGGTTPNDVRHFPPSSYLENHHLLLLPGRRDVGSGGSSSSSSSVIGKHLDRSPHELDKEEEHALAEYREALMYQRMLDFKNKRMQQKLQEAKREEAYGPEPPVLLRPRPQQDCLEDLLSRPCQPLPAAGPTTHLYAVDEVHPRSHHFHYGGGGAGSSSSAEEADCEHEDDGGVFDLEL